MILEQNSTGLYRTIEYYAESYRTLWNLYNQYGTELDYSGLYSTINDIAGPKRRYRAIPNYTGL